MLKKLLITFMGFILISSISLAGYKIFEPNNLNNKNTGDIYLTLSTVSEYTLSNGNNTNIFYFFCKKDDKNCIYIYDSLIPSIKTANGNNISNLIQYVDISEDLENSKSILSKFNKWSITKYPAFVSCKVENNEIIINSILEYDDNNPLNIDDIILWLTNNNVEIK